MGAVIHTSPMKHGSSRKRGSSSKALSLTAGELKVKCRQKAHITGWHHCFPFRLQTELVEGSSSHTSTSVDHVTTGLLVWLKKPQARSQDFQHWLKSFHLVDMCVTFTWTFKPAYLFCSAFPPSLPYVPTKLHSVKPHSSQIFFLEYAPQYHQAKF